MPVLAEYQDDVIILRLLHRHTKEELRDAFESGFPDPETTARGLLIDLTHSLSVRDGAISDEGWMAEWWRAHGGRFRRRVALLAHPHSIHWGVARLGAAAMESAHVAARVFGDEALAHAWLIA